MSLNLARRMLKASQAKAAARIYAVASATTGDTDATGGCIPLDAGGYAFAGSHYTTENLAVVGVFPNLQTATPTWIRQLEMSGTGRMNAQGGRSVGTDSSGNVYLLAYGYPNGGSLYHAHIAQYNSSGTYQWQRRLYSGTLNLNTPVTNLSVDASGNSYMALNVLDTVYYGICSKHNSSGTHQWQRKLSQATYHCGYNGTTLSHDGGVIAVGYMQDGSSSGNNRRGIVVKYNSSGTIQWQFKIHLSERGEHVSATVDQVTGDIYVGGFSGSSEYATLWKLDSSGVVQWVVKSSASNLYFSSVAHDDVTGFTYAQANDVSNDYVYNLCFDTAGAVVWSRRTKLGTTNSPNVGAVVIDTNDDTKLIVSSTHYDSAVDTHGIIQLIPKTGGGATGSLVAGGQTYTLESTNAWTWSSPASTKANAGLTDAAGALTEAAGTATDAASTLTFDDGTT